MKTPMSEPNESQKPLDFDLRDRIAAALLRAAYRRGVNRLSNADGEFMADAVIAELGIQRASRPNDYGHVDYPAGDRYITDWIADV